MKTVKTILIADRNPHIRKFLRRELCDSGHRVRSVDSARDLLQLIYSDTPIDLLVLDPDIPCMDPGELARKILDRIPQIPVVLHCVQTADELFDYGQTYAVHIEKNGHSVESLKEAIHRIL